MVNDRQHLPEGGNPLPPRAIFGAKAIFCRLPLARANLYSKRAITGLHGGPTGKKIPKSGKSSLNSAGPLPFCNSEAATATKWAATPPERERNYR